MKYFFILGSNPSLSTAEINAIFPGDKISLVNENVLFLDTNNKIKTNDLIASMGGTIKIGEILFEENEINIEVIIKKVGKYISFQEGSKFKFGISYYGRKSFNEKKLAMELKKFLHEKNINSRWVTSKEKTLSSVVVEQNKLTRNGMELIIIENGKNYLIGKTLDVQPFKELSFRDYGRPARDDRSGMLPPKLAQILINLSGAKKDDVILDPFCGSGTIITEAMLMGYKNLIGTDLSLKAVNDTKENSEWIKAKFNCSDINIRLFQTNVQSLAQKIKANSISAIITEPYLGPQRGSVNQQKIKLELENLYSKAIEQFAKILKSTGTIVMVWPVQMNKKEKIKLNPNIRSFKIKLPLSQNFTNNFSLTNRQTIIYGREGQKIWREIVVLKK